MKILKKLRTLLIIIAYSMGLILVIPPVFNLINQIEPWIFGMPFLIFWIILINIIIAIILVLLWNIDKKLERGED